MATIIFLMYHNYQDIHWRHVHDLDVDLPNWSTSNVTWPIERPYITCYWIAKIIFTVSVTIQT